MIRLAILKYKSIFGRTLNIFKKTVSHTESEPGYGQVEDAGRSAPLVRWSPRVRAKAYQSLFKPFQVDPKPSKSTLQWKKPCEPKIVTPERQPHPSHKQGSPHRRRKPLHARKHRVSRDFKPPNITLTQQFHCDLQSLPRKSHCNDNVLW